MSWGGAVSLPCLQMLWTGRAGPWAATCCVGGPGYQTSLCLGVPVCQVEAPAPASWGVSLWV